MTTAIAIDQVSKTYANGQQALCDFSLNVKAGEVFGFLGANGAGKTTTIKIVLGLLRASSGKVRVAGGDPTLAETRARVGYLPEVANYYEFMTPVELLSLYGKLCNLSRAEIRERTDVMLELVGLQEVRRRPLKQFSKGMLQRAGIAQALLHDPEILVLDEPMTGLDPLARRQMRDIFVAMNRQGKTVFFSSHELSEAEMICDRVGILCGGRLSWCGPTRDVAGSGERNLERIFLDIIGGQESGVA